MRIDSAPGALLSPKHGPVAEDADPSPGRVRGAAVCSIGVAVPDGGRQRADRRAARRRERWIVARTGVRERRVAPPRRRLLRLAAAAARRALAGGRASAADELDLVLVATMSHEQLTPSAAPLVADRDRRRSAPARSTSTPPARASSPRSRWPPARSRRAARETVLVVGADLMSRLTDPDDRATAALFGDGAGAAVVRASDGAGRIGPVVLGADGARGDLITADRAEGLHADEGPRHLPPGGRPALRGDARRRARPPGSRSTRSTSSPTTRPTAGSSPPSASASGSIRRAGDRLHRPLRQHVGGDDPDRARRGAAGRAASRRAPRVLLAAFGGGLTWAATVIEWGRDERLSRR